jgi:hypothetical protein
VVACCSRLNRGRPDFVVPNFGLFRLPLAVPGKGRQVSDAIHYVEPQFSQLPWFGFSRVGKPGSVFYVDNVRLELVEK